jgi:hypothetical protein
MYIRHQREALRPLATPVSPVPPPDSAALASFDRKAYPDLDFDKPFDPQGFRRHIESYALILSQHLVDELETLSPEIMVQVPEKEDLKMRADLQSHMQAYSPYWFLCSVLCKHNFAQH